MTDSSAKALIGAFVLGAIALLVAFIMLLGAGAFHSKNPTYSLFFRTSLKGLTQGSPVYFKGIRIGKVKTIQIRPEVNKKAFQTPVIIEIEKNKATTIIQSDEKELFANKQIVRNMIDNGLRARLGVASILTGQLCVELDLLPNADPINYDLLPPYHGSPQIPTQLSSMDAAMETLENIPMQQVLINIFQSIDNLGTQLQKTDVAGLAESMKLTSDAIREQTVKLSSVQQSVMKTLKDYDALALTLQSGSLSTFKDASDLIASLNRLSNSANQSANKLQNTLREASMFFSQTRKNTEGAGKLLREDSATFLEINRAMSSLHKAAQAFTDLARVLEMNPNSVIFGRK